MSAHTPGPWTFNFRSVTGGDGRTVADPALIYARGESVPESFVGRQEKEAGEIFRANGRLIAAAPDLLEALTDLRNATCSETIEAMVLAVAKADAALKKARGA